MCVRERERERVCRCEKERVFVCSRERVYVCVFVRPVSNKNLVSFVGTVEIKFAIRDFQKK